MVYGVHYTITAQGKSGKVFTANILEKGYSDPSVQIDASANPFIHNILASSDDQFNPVLASELILNLDITDFTEGLPDLTTRDDKKYFITFYAGSDLIFQGYLLTDATSLNFSAGRRILNIPCVDGLGMLQSIPYLQNYASETPTSENGAVLVDINTTETLLEVILNCLNQLQLPQGFKLNVACNIYSASMSESSDPFSQINYFLRNWQNQDLTWMNCRSILETICTSFGCQIFQAKGQYFIVNVAERDAANLRYFQYDQDGTLTNSGSLSVSKTVEPYTTTSEHYFINNEQHKVIRKGYPVIEIKNQYQYAPNLIDNGNLKRPASSGFDIVYGWRKSVGAGGSINLTTTGDFVSINMNTVAGSTSVTPLSVARCFTGDILTLSFLMDGHTSVSASPAIRLQIIAVGLVTDSFSLNSDKQWINASSGVYCDIVGTTVNLYERVSVDMPPLPLDCTVYISFMVTAGTTIAGTTFGDVKLTAQSPNQYKIAKGYSDFLSQYKKEQTVVMGGQQDENMCLTGALVYVHGLSISNWSVYHGWYRYGKTESYNNLPRLLLQQYINIQSAAQINLEGSISSIFDSVDFISLLNTIKFTDGTYIYSVSGKSYIPGNMTLNYIDDSTRGTWLQVSNTEITETITDYTIQKQ